MVPPSPGLLNTAPRAVTTERIAVEVKIGIQSIPRELMIETNASAQDVEAALTSAMADGGLFMLRDDKGGKIIVPVDKIGYLEFSGSDQRRVGFSSL